MKRLSVRLAIIIAIILVSSFPMGAQKPLKAFENAWIEEANQEVIKANTDEAISDMDRKNLANSKLQENLVLELINNPIKSQEIKLWNEREKVLNENSDQTNRSPTHNNTTLFLENSAIEAYGWVLTERKPVHGITPAPVKGGEVRVSFGDDAIEMLLAKPYGNGAGGSQDLKNPQRLHARYSWTVPEVIQPGGQLVIVVKQEVLSNNTGKWGNTFGVGIMIQNNWSLKGKMNDGTVVAPWAFGIGLGRPDWAQKNAVVTYERTWLWNEGKVGDKRMVSVSVQGVGTQKFEYLYEWKPATSKEVKKNPAQAQTNNTDSQLRKQYEPAIVNVASVEMLVGDWDLVANGYAGKMEITYVCSFLEGRIFFNSLKKWEPLEDLKFNISTKQFTFYRPQAKQQHEGILNGATLSGTFNKTSKWTATKTDQNGTKQSSEVSVKSSEDIFTSNNLKKSVIKLNVDLNNTDVIAGDLMQNSIQLMVSEGTFNQKVNLQVTEGESAVQFDKKRANLIGTPFDITIDQEQKRLKKPVIIKLKLDQKEIASLKRPIDLCIGYFNGKIWDYFPPLEVNLKKKYVKFETYHFSEHAKADLTKMEQINTFAYTNAVNKWAEKDNNLLTIQATQQMIKQILSKNMGIDNKSLTQDIVEKIMKENDYAKLLVSYNDNKMDEFGTDLAVLAGKKIFEVVSNESNAKALLGSVTEHSSKIGAGINIGLALAAGDLEKAAKELSLEIINTYPLTKAFKAAAEITERQVNRWRDQELEAAYQVFVNGAESSIPFWGYQVEPGNFDEVWSQMRGLENKIQDDALKNYAAANNISVSQIQRATIEMVRKQTKENLRLEFSKRKEQESAIENLKAENLKLVEEFEKANLMIGGRFGYTDNTSFDFRLERLFRIKDMILKDTKSRIGFTGVDEGGVISAKTVAGLIQLWYSAENGKEKYREELIKLGYSNDTKQVAAIDGAAFEGVWAGQFKHEELWLPGITGFPLLFVVYNVGNISMPQYRALFLDIHGFEESNSYISIFPMTENQTSDSQFPAMLSGFKNGDFLFHFASIDEEGETVVADITAIRLKTPAAPLNLPEAVSLENMERAYAAHLRDHEESLRRLGKTADAGSMAGVQAIHSGAQDMIKDARLFYKQSPTFQRVAEKWLKDPSLNVKANIEADRKAFSVIMMQE